jgi:uncharacterized protein YndB with AHSA1/START domain
VDICSDRRFRFDVERAEVWTAITCTEQYRNWWPWLREFDGRTFEEGARWSCVVKPPLPYRLRFDVVLIEVFEHDIVRARIEGDITGWAELTAVDRDDGCELRLVSELSPASGPLRLVARVARPVAAFGHDWVLDSGVRQFRGVALPSP